MIGSVDAALRSVRRESPAVTKGSRLAMLAILTVALCTAPATRGQSTLPSQSTLAVSGTDPYNLTCNVGGTMVPKGAGPSGTVTFTDLTAGQTIGTANLGAPGLSGYSTVSTQLASSGIPQIQMAAGDFNGDGKMDFVDVSSTSISVYLGNGDGTFQAPIVTSISAPRDLGAIVVADFNGDGYADVAISGRDVEVYIGNKDGTFQAPQSYAASLSHLAMAVGDFGNGHLDIAVADSSYDSVTILVGDGTGAFPTSYTYAVGGSPQGIAIADFNQDGKPDLAVTSETDSAVSVLLGNGDGTFQAQQTYPTGQNGAQYVAAGDFNGDGKPDVVFVGISSGDIEVMLNDGTGGLMAPIAEPVPAPAGGTFSSNVGIVAADFNGDGNLDLAMMITWIRTADQGVFYSFLVAYGDGTGSFPSSDFVTLPPVPTGLVAADFDGDGNLDLASESGQIPLQIVVALSQRRLASAALSNQALNAGTTPVHSLQCSYAGDSNYSASTSASVPVTIPAAPAPAFSLAAGAIPSRNP